VEQIRNAHDYYKDFLEEDDLYHKAGELVKFLVNWQAPAAGDLPAIISALAYEMVKREFWGKEDARLIDDWLEDLREVGYTFPPRKNPEWHQQELAAKQKWIRPLKTTA